MELPIEYPAPKRDKYIDEETPMFNRWMIFGEHENGNVDVADNSQDIILNIPRWRAEEIVFARHVFVDQVMQLIRI